MEESTVENKTAECKAKEIESCSSSFFSKYTHLGSNFLKKLVQFICYGPGVLGFLWLIGRILKR
jgi:hypothetical protein